MSLFGVFESLTKAAVSVVTVPLAVVADVATMGGHLTDEERTYTGAAVGDLMDNLKDATRPDR